MDLFTLIPRTIIGVTYPAFASLKAVLSDSPESCGAWLRYWVVLGVFSLVELLLDLAINPLPYSFPTYLVLKCAFLAWCMAPVDWNGSDVIFSKNKADKSDKGEKITKSLFKKMESSDKKESD